MGFYGNVIQYFEGLKKIIFKKGDNQQTVVEQEFSTDEEAILTVILDKNNILEASMEDANIKLKAKELKTKDPNNDGNIVFLYE